MSHILTKDCASMTHRDVACLFRTPEHKYPLALWDISSAAPPGLAEKKWRGGPCDHQGQSQSGAATCAEESKAIRETCQVP